VGSCPDVPARKSKIKKLLAARGCLVLWTRIHTTKQQWAAATFSGRPKRLSLSAIRTACHDQTTK
jgi:hypothetical protein